MINEINVERIITEFWFGKIWILLGLVWFELHIIWFGLGWV